MQNARPATAASRFGRRLREMTDAKEDERREGAGIEAVHKARDEDGGRREACEEALGRRVGPDGVGFGGGLPGGLRKVCRHGGAEAGGDGVAAAEGGVPADNGRDGGGEIHAKPFAVGREEEEVRHVTDVAALDTQGLAEVRLGRGDRLAVGRRAYGTSLLEEKVRDHLRRRRPAREAWPKQGKQKGCGGTSFHRLSATRFSMGDIFIIELTSR